MKLKKIGCLAAVMALTCGMLSCGEAKKPEGLYYRIEPLELKFYEDYVDDLDDALKDYSEDNANLYSIEFDGDEAEIYEMYSGATYDTYIAEYKIDEKTGQFTFDYQSLERLVKGETIKVEPGDKSDDLKETALISKLEMLNDGGGAPRYSFPWIAINDKFADLGYLPKPVIYSGAGNNIVEGYPANLYNMGDVLCSEIYGFELDGKYKPGKRFTLKFDQLEAFRNGPAAEVYEDSLYQKEDIIAAHYHSEKTDSTIEFDDGEWTWYNHEGDVINDGEYIESEDYEGLIAMYYTGESEKMGVEDPYIVYNMYAEKPIFLYITDDGEIYYPALIKEK